MKESAIGESWDDLEKEIFTPDEIIESQLRVEIIGEIIKARQAQGFSRKKLKELSGVGESTIARIEKGYISYKTNTLLKILAALGKTLAIVPIKTA